jgi:pimeloyl-ACP methyl ester carboxylesterase
MISRTVYTKIFLGEFGRSCDEANVKLHLHKWWQSKRTKDEGGLRLSLEGFEFLVDELKLENVWVGGWSFGTEIALKHVSDPRIKGLILLSPPMMKAAKSDLERWADDGRPVIALIPEFDDYLTPVEAPFKFRELTQIKLINVDGAKHLWVGEPAVHRVLTEIVNIVAPARLPLPTEL